MKPLHDGSGCNYQNPKCTQHLKDQEGGDITTTHASSLLPFEFQALEACLEAACHRLDLEVLYFSFLICAFCHGLVNVRKLKVL